MSKKNIKKVRIKISKDCKLALSSIGPVIDAKKDDIHEVTPDIAGIKVGKKHAVICEYKAEEPAKEEQVITSEDKAAEPEKEEQVITSGSMRGKRKPGEPKK